MERKPIVSLWSLGEYKHKAMLRAALAGAPPPAAGVSAKSERGPIPYIEIESPERRYRLISRLGAPTQVTGAILTLSLAKRLKPKDKTSAQLLFASRFISDLVVVWLDCASKPAEEIDQEERALRGELSRLGFEGDAAQILRVNAEAPADPELDALFDLLDAIPIRPPSSDPPKELPAKIAEKKRAQALLSVRQLVRPVAPLKLYRSSTEALFRGPITTQFGGMPYLEKGEPWPTCYRCKTELRFICQIDARDGLKQKLKNLGLYVFYVCNEDEHQEATPIARYYKEPREEKRTGPVNAANRPFAQTNNPITPSRVEYEWDLQLPVHDTVEAYMETLSTPVNLNGIEARKDSWDIYQEIKEELGVEEVTLDFDAHPPLQIGGYSFARESAGELQCCGKCKKPYKTLANIHFSRGLWFPWSYRQFQFLLCDCTPEQISITTEEREFERYGWARE